MPRPALTEEKRKQIIDLYVEKKLGKKRIAKELNVSTATITKVLKQEGIKAHEKGGRPKTGKSPRPKYYTLWLGIKRRCNNPNVRSYKYYGGRGIGIDPAWGKSYKKFEAYIEQNLGERPEGYSIDRIDPNSNYEPGNIRWASTKTQARNKTTNVCNEAIAKELREAHISKRNEGDQSVKQLAKIHGLTYTHAKKISRGEIWG